MPKDGELRFITAPIKANFFQDNFTPGIDYLEYTKSLLKDFSESNVPRYNKRLAIIPNVGGQKYTIGSRFISRETQGEFIFYQNEGIGISHCEIHCDEAGNFWVMPIKNCPTFINDEPVLEKMQLNFGDFLVLIEDSNGVFSRERYVKFLFIEREFHIDLFQKPEKICFPNPIMESEKRLIRFAHQNNGIVLSKIMQFLPHSKLKSCRFISSSFNSAAKRVLTKISVATLKFVCNGKQPGNPTFFQYLHEMKNMNIQTVKIQLEAYEREHSQPLKEKLMEDLTLFLNNIQEVASIQELRIATSFETTTNTKVMAQIFEKFCKTIKTLQLPVFFCPMDANECLQPFQSLNSLSLCSFGGYYHDGHWQWAPEWILNFIKNCPNVVKLKMRGDAHGAWFENISEFKFLEELIFVETCSRNMPYLCEFDKPLKRLELGELYEFGNAEFKKFEQLLKTQAANLITLKFTLSSQGPHIYIDNVGFVKTSGVKILELPNFPKLKSLGIEQKLIPGQREFLFKFPDGEELDYEKVFPVLEKLELSATNKFNDEHADEECFDGEDVDCWEQVFQQFVKKGVICKSLRKLNVANVNELENLREIFPNAFYLM